MAGSSLVGHYEHKSSTAIVARGRGKNVNPLRRVPALGDGEMGRA